MRPEFTRCLAVTSAAIICTAMLASDASAVVIDFESTLVENGVSNGGPASGFTLSPYDGVVGGGFNDDSSFPQVTPTANSGHKFMLNFNSLIGEFTKDVGTFTLNSLFVHADARVGASTVRFQGLDGKGGNVLHTIDVAINSQWQKVNFSNWDSVKTFTWDSLVPGTSNIAIDDFEYDAVPEPATLFLFGTGFVGLVGYARRRR